MGPMCPRIGRCSQGAIAVFLRVICTVLFWTLPACQKSATPVALSQMAAPAQTAPTATQPDKPAAMPVQEVPDAINQLLDKLEKSAADLNAFTARITFEKQDNVLDRREI